MPYARIEDKQASNRIHSYKRCTQATRVANAVKMMAGCIDCGYSAHPAALTFDHRDPSNKKYQISKCRGSLKLLFTEIEKCDVRCHNCHHIRHFEQRREEAQ